MWQVMIDGLFTAAELFVLLFVSPVGAAQPPPMESASHRPALATARDAHLLSSSFDVRLLGALADVRVSQHYRNDNAEPIDLATRLPPVDEYTGALRIHRRGRIFDLLQLASGCGGDADGEDVDDNDGNSDVRDAQAIAGHAQLAVDESVADALQLAPGEKASIELVATLPLSRMGTTYRITLPEHAAIESQALLVDQTDRRFLAHFLVVVPHRAARGTVRLTLRPERGAPQTIELGVLNGPSTAYVIPIATRGALQALAAGAIELETRTSDGIVWSTLATHLRTDSSVTLAGTDE